MTNNTAIASAPAFTATTTATDTLTYKRVLRDNIPAQRLRDVAETQGRSRRHRDQRARLVRLAAIAEEERGW